MFEKIINEIKLFLNGEHEYDAMDFSLYLEDYLCDNYDEMYKENPKLTKLINEEVPDICAAVEPGDNGIKFKEFLIDELNSIGLL